MSSFSRPYALQVVYRKQGRGDRSNTKEVSWSQQSVYIPGIRNVHECAVSLIIEGHFEYQIQRSDLFSMTRLVVIVRGSPILE